MTFTVPAGLTSSSTVPSAYYAEFLSRTGIYQINLNNHQGVDWNYQILATDPALANVDTSSCFNFVWSHYLLVAGSTGAPPDANNNPTFSSQLNATGRIIGDMSTNQTPLPGEGNQLFTIAVNCNIDAYVQYAYTSQGTGIYSDLSQSEQYYAYDDWGYFAPKSDTYTPSGGGYDSSIYTSTSNIQVSYSGEQNGSSLYDDTSITYSGVGALTGVLVITDTTAGTSVSINASEIQFAKNYDGGGNVFNGTGYITKTFGGDLGLNPTHQYSVTSTLSISANGTSLPLGGVSAGIAAPDGWTLNLVQDGSPVDSLSSTTDSAGNVSLNATGTLTAPPPPPPPPAQPPLTTPVDDASGALYRKVALNGQPLGDGKPQTASESDQQPEETFVDAMTLQLRHQVTDAYATMPTIDLSLSVRRIYPSEVWDYRYGLRPNERYDQPFGTAWSSNLAANIKFVNILGTTQSPPPVPTAVVTDENGTSFTFLRNTDASGHQTFIPFPTAKSEQATFLATLTCNTDGSYTFVRKFGTKLTFVMTPLTNSLASDRMVTPIQQYDTYTYARLASVSDRVGNTIVYTYPAANTLIPSSIGVQGNPALSIRISSTNGLVTDIWDADGYRTSFVYQDLSNMEPGSGDPSTTDARVLTQVVHPDGTVTHYAYDCTSQDQDQRSTTEVPYEPNNPDPVYNHYHCDLTAITNQDSSGAGGTTYGFTPALDVSRFDYSVKASTYYQKTGLSRIIASTTMPDGTGATFVNNSLIEMTSVGSGTAVALAGSAIRETAVTNALGFTRTYDWTNGQAYTVNVPPTLLTQNPVPPNPIIVYYTTMTVTDGSYGHETFTFDPNAGLALSAATDLSGNTTTYTHTDTNPFSGAYNAAIASPGQNINSYCDDPDSQTNAIGGVKKFTYDPTMRIMTSATDELGRQTVYTLNAAGLRTSETVSDPNGTPVKQTTFTYGSSSFPGFMTSKTVSKLDSYPTGEGPLLTQYVPDANGRIAQEIIDPAGKNLVTTYTYGPSGEKRTVTDPLGHVTSFSYDNRHRLVATGFQDGSSKTFTYDYRGNKTGETDENGHQTLYAYDNLNRLTSSTRVMGGASNIVTSHTYNAVNAGLTTTDPNGNTGSMAYDDLQRVISSTSPAVPVNGGSPQALTTTFAYGTNSGGSVFDTTPWKPVTTTNPRGFTTTVTYDALYRPTSTSTLYGAGTSTTATQYDAVGNATQSTEPSRPHDNHDL